MDLANTGLKENQTDDDFVMLNTVLPKSILITAYVLVHALSLTGNLFVLMVIWKHPRMKGVTNILLGNLAAADLAIAVFCTGQQYILMLYLEDWVFGAGLVGRSLCKVYGFSRTAAYMTSINILLLVTVERFLAIVHPFTSRAFLMSRSTLRNSVIIAWTFSCIVSLPNAIGFDAFPHQYYDDKLKVTVTQIGCYRDYMLPYMNWDTYDLAIYVFWYFVPVTVMLVLYLIIGRHLKHSADRDFGDGSQRHIISIRGSESGDSFEHDPRKCGGTSTGEEGGEKLVLSKEEQPDKDVIGNRKRVVRIFMMLVAIFVLCWLPLHIRKLLMYLRGYEDWMGNWLLPISDWFISLNSALNPIIYTVFSGRFRSCARDILFGRLDDRRYIRSARFPYLRKHS